MHVAFRNQSERSSCLFGAKKKKKRADSLLQTDPQSGTNSSKEPKFSNRIIYYYYLLLLAPSRSPLHGGFKGKDALLHYPTTKTVISSPSHPHLLPHLCMLSFVLVFCGIT